MRLGLGMGLSRREGGWTPRQYADLAAMYRSDVVTLNGSTVAAWPDQSGNSRTVTQATPSQQPVYSAADVAYMGRPSLSFASASSQVLASLSLSVPQPLSIFIVGNIVATASASPEFLDGNSVTRCLVGAPTSSTNVQIYAGSVPVTSTSSVALPSAIVAVMNGATSASYVNNSAVAVGSGNAGANGLAAIAIGGGVVGGFMNGKILEVVIVGRAVSQSDRALFMAYAQRRYGLSAS